MYIFCHLTSRHLDEIKIFCGQPSSDVAYIIIVLYVAKNRTRALKTCKNAWNSHFTLTILIFP